METKSTCNDVIRNFPEELFVGQTYRRIDDQKPRPSLPKLKSENVYIGRRVEQTNVNQMYHRRGLEAKPQEAGQFFGKQAILMPLDHILHVFKTI